MRDLKRNYEVPLFYPPPGSKWNITGKKKKKEHSVNRDDFESYFAIIII